jgi:hypothetical protein
VERALLFRELKARIVELDQAQATLKDSQLRLLKAFL